MRPVSVVALLACVLAVSASVACAGPARDVAPVSPTAANGEIRRTLIGKQPAHEAGYETRLYLIEYPPGAKASPHVHPAVGVGLVLEGEFESAFGDEAPVIVKANESFVDKADTPHRLFRNTSATAPLRFVIAYTLRADEPPFRPIEPKTAGISASAMLHRARAWAMGSKAPG